MQIYCLFGVKSTHFGHVVCSPASSPFPSLAACKANGWTLDIRGMSRASAQAKPGRSFKTSTAIRGPGDLDEGDVSEGKQDVFPWNHRVNMEPDFRLVFQKN